MLTGKRWGEKYDYPVLDCAKMLANQQMRSLFLANVAKQYFGSLFFQTVLAV